MKIETKAAEYIICLARATMVGPAFRIVYIFGCLHWMKLRVYMLQVIDI
jgi:hypothetical protein